MNIIEMPRNLEYNKNKTKRNACNEDLHLCTKSPMFMESFIVEDI